MAAMKGVRMAALGLRYLGRMLRAAGDRLDPDGVRAVDDLQIAFGDSAVLFRLDGDQYIGVAPEDVNHG
jgi:hypothetical protein